MSNKGVDRLDGTRTLNISFGNSGYILEYRVDPETAVVSRIFHRSEDRA